MPRLALSLLGTFQAMLDGKPITAFESNKVRGLLAYLAIESDRLHSRDALAGLFWSDYSNRDAHNNLRYALSNLREAIGDRKADPPFLCISRDAIQFNPASDYDLDVRAWQSTDKLPIPNLQSLISAYRGVFLEGFACDSAPFEEWVVFTRERINQRVLHALDTLIKHFDERGRYDRVEIFARKQIEIEPWDEPAHQALMRALVQNGQRSAALAQYDKCRRLLKQELDAEPARETTQLYESIRDGTFARRTPNNLPIPLSSFVGRAREIAEVKRLLGTTRLLTLTGAGGCGKTRLAIQVAQDLCRDDQSNRLYQDGIWWIDLAPLNDVALVPQTIAAVLDLQEIPNQSLTATLANYFHAKESLLILDNCEHLIDTCAQIVGVLLSACPKLHFLTTSRESLNISGESIWQVPSLNCLTTALPLEQLRQYDAIQLFTERARAVAPRWSLAGNGTAVTEICARLDGIPLAIELAAARLTVLSAEQIRVRLADRFNLLTLGSRTALPRHQTLRAALDWSYDLLSDAERAVMRRLAVFAGGWSLEAAEAICASIEPPLLDWLTSLVNKSLVVVEHVENAMRYRMLETVREYARAKLLESDQAAMARDRHLDYYLKLAQAVEPKLHGPEQFVWLEHLELEHNNLRAALEWSSQGNAEQGLELAAALYEFWDMRGSWSEGRELVAHLLTRPEVADKNLVRANGLLVAGVINWRLSDLKASRRYLDELVSVARALGEPGKELLALALGYLGHIVYGDDFTLGESLIDEGLVIARSLATPGVIARVLALKGSCLAGRLNYPAAQQVYVEAVALYQSIGDKRNAAYMLRRVGSMIFSQHDYATARRYIEQTLIFAQETKDRWGILNSLNMLGDIERVEGQYDLAKSDYVQALEITREIGHMGMVMSILGNLAAIALHGNDLAAAQSYCTEKLALAQRMNRPLHIAASVLEFAGIFAMRRQARQAAQLLAVVDTFIGSGDVRSMTPADVREVEHYLNLARGQLDEATFNAAWAEGQKMTLEQAVEYALENLNLAKD